jgi:hypothetical protein
MLTKLQKATDDYYPGMFIPSTLIIIMNEIKRGHYSVNMHNVKPDFTGRYTSVTIRSDRSGWGKKRYATRREEYGKKYGTNSFTQFACVFMLNILQSKAKIQNYVLKLRESDFLWLIDIYNEKKQHYQHQYGTQTFEEFADVFLKEILEKVDAAKRILTI